jgi:hypothetical protein
VQSGGRLFDKPRYTGARHPQSDIAGVLCCGNAPGARRESDDPPAAVINIAFAWSGRDEPPEAQKAEDRRQIERPI